MNVEDRTQAAIVDFVRTVAPDVIVYAVPNGGLRSKREAAKLKWTGVTAGVFDLTLLLPGGRAACIEVKAPKGSLSREQKDFRQKLISLGIPYCVARSIDDVRLALEQWQIHTREAGR